MTAAVSCRRPEVVVLSCSCALLLRIAWVPLGSISGLALSIYKPAAVLLTGATAFLSMAAVFKLCFAKLQEPKDHLNEMVEGVKGVVIWHRTLLLLDWLLSIFSDMPLATKVQLACSFIVYGIAVEYLTTSAEALNAQLR